MFMDFILIFIAAMCAAIMDTVKDHFKYSIFDLIKEEKWRLWFNSDGKSWKNKYIDRQEGKGLIKWYIFGIKFNKPVQVTDAWHYFKMIMIFMLCLIPALHLGNVHFINYFGVEHKFWNIMTHWVLLGTTWNLTFNIIFYNWLLLKKTWKK